MADPEKDGLKLALDKTAVGLASVFKWLIQRKMD